MTINSAARLTGNAISSMTSVTGSVASSIGKSGVDLVGMGTQAFEELVPMPELKNADVNLEQALQKSGIPELQPNYLKAQLEWAKGQVQTAAKDLVLNPNDSDRIIQTLSNTLKSRAESITSAVNKQEVSQALAANSNLSPQEAERVVNNYLQQQDQFFVKLEENIQQAKVRYAQVKVEAKEKAAAATNAAAKAALWSFFGLLIGLIVSVFSGKMGMQHRIKTQRHFR